MTIKVKELFAQLRSAANGVKAQIHELDDQIFALTEQRRALTDAPVSKADIMEYVRADIQRRAANYQWRLKKMADEGGLSISFSNLERRHVKGEHQPFPYLDGNPMHGDFHNIEPHGIFWNFGNLIAEQFAVALDKVECAADTVPVADRRRMIAEIDAKLEKLNAEQDGLAGDLISSGVTE